MENQYPLLKRPPDPGTPTVASDLDGTLTSGRTVPAIHAYLEQNGRVQESRAIYRRRIAGFALRKALGMSLRQVKNDWMRELIGKFAGLPIDEVRRMADWVVANEIWANRREAVIEELNAHLSAGRRVVVVTGMPDILLESLLVKLPGIEAIGTLVEDPGEIFSGRLGDFNVGRRKVESLEPFAGPDGKIYAAYGDTYPDLAMLLQSKHPNVVSPDKKLRREAIARGWRILEG